jgi:hypothetical protein
MTAAIPGGGGVKVSKSDLAGPAPLSLRDFFSATKKFRNGFWPFQPLPGVRQLEKQSHFNGCFERTCVSARRPREYFPIYFHTPGGRSNLWDLPFQHRWPSSTNFFGSFGGFFYRVRQSRSMSVSRCVCVPSPLRKIVAKFGVGGSA